MLAQMPEVEMITPNEVKGSVTPVNAKTAAPKTSMNLEWSLDLLDVPAAWQVTKGEGVVVANIDSGVRYTHEALVDSYRGNSGNGTFSHNFNWYDPMEFNNDDWWCPGPPECNMNGEYPWDGFAHGTHTMGTMVGSLDWSETST